MKRKVITAAVAAMLMLTTVTTPSCIGSFSLTNRLLAWNEHVGDKFVNELVFFAFLVLPVYEVACLADILVLNSIEFWSGDNPMAKGTKVIEGTDGRYLVKCDGRGYDIISMNDNTKVRLDFNTADQSWSYVDSEGISHTIFTFVDDTHISVPVGNDTWQTVELSANGLMAYRHLIEEANFAAK